MNLYLPAPNPLMSQVSFYPQSFPQQAPPFNPSMGFEGFNNNFYAPSNTINTTNQINPVNPINPMELGIAWKSAGVASTSNNNIYADFNSYSSYYNPYLQQNVQYQHTTHKSQYQEDPNIISKQSFRKEQIQSFERPYFQPQQTQDHLKRGNTQTLKRRATNTIEEFEIMNLKKHQQQYFGFVLPHN